MVAALSLTDQADNLITVNWGSLSFQMHRHRAEHLIVVKGMAKVTNGDNVFLLEEN